MAFAEEHGVPCFHDVAARVDIHNSDASAAKHCGAADWHQGVANQYQGKCVDHFVKKTLFQAEQLRLNIVWKVIYTY